MSETKISQIPLDAVAFSDEDKRKAQPLFLSPVAAGFPSPAEGHLDRRLDLHSFVVKNPTATYFVRAAGDSMLRAGIHNGDLLVVDRSQEAVNGSIVIAAVEGELTVKRLLRKNGRVLLVPENDDYPELDVTEQEDALIWGVVTYAIHKLKPDALGAR
jgi:DNA polymerase V